MSEAPNSAVQDLEKLIQPGSDARKQMEPIWFMNLAYYAGQQWLRWNGAQLVKPRLSGNRVLITDNRIQPTVRRLLAKKTKARPVWTAVANSMDERDIVGARLGEFYLDDAWFRLYLSARLRTALKWADIAGAGFWKVYYDPTVGAKGEVVVQKGSNTPVVDHFGKPIDPGLMDQAIEAEHAANGREAADAMRAKVETRLIAEGDMAVEVRSPFQLLVDPLAEYIDDAAWVSEETVKSPEWVKERYNVDVKPDSYASVGLIEARMSASSIGQVTSDHVGVRVKELWMPPQSGYAQGRRVVWAGNQILEEDNNPVERTPYLMFSGIEVPGRFYPSSVVEAMRPMQTERNKLLSQLIENAGRVGNPALLVSRLSQVKMTGLPGERIEFDDTTQNAAPRFLPAPEMPAYIQNLVELNSNALDEVSGSHEVSRAQVPPGVTAAAAINLLQEADDTILGPQIEDMETQLSHAGQMLLEGVAEHYTTARSLHIVGDEGAWDIPEFKGSMLRGNTRVRCQAGSMMPKSKAAKQAEMTNVLTLLVQNGVQLNQRNLRRFFKEYEAGAVERLIADVDIDERYIREEHRRILAGEQVQVDPLVDNMQAHLEGHLEQLKSAEVSLWPQEARDALRAHAQETQDYLDGLQQQEQQAQIDQMHAQTAAEAGAKEAASAAFAPDQAAAQAAAQLAAQPDAESPAEDGGESGEEPQG